MMNALTSLVPRDDRALAGNHIAVRRTLHLIEEMSPALGLHVNLAKCELFSRKGNTSFTQCEVFTPAQLGYPRCTNR